VIRPATAGDLDKILAIARAAYADFDFDDEACRQWALKAFQNPDVLIAVGNHGFGVSGVSAPFWAPLKRRGVMVFLASTGGSGYEPCAILRYMIKWALRDRGASTYHFGEDTGVNFAPYAKRVGATLDRASYVVTNGQNF
jgi:hypothetical protein